MVALPRKGQCATGLDRLFMLKPAVVKDSLLRTDIGQIKKKNSHKIRPKNRFQKVKLLKLDF